MRRRFLSLTAIGLLLFGSDVVFQRATWPVARLHAAVTYITGALVRYNSGATDTTVTSSPDVDFTGATLIVIVQCSNADVGFAPADGPGNSYTSLTPSRNFAANQVSRIWYKINPTTSASWHFTASSSTGAYLSAIALAFSGTGAYDSQQNQTDAASGTTIQAGSVTPTLASSLAVTDSCHGDATFTGITVSVGSSYTIPATPGQITGNSHFGLEASYNTVSAATNPVHTMSSSDNNLTANIAIFQPAAATVKHLGSLLGIGSM